MSDNNSVFETWEREMKHLHVRTFRYNCSCGHQVMVFCDAGTPQEFYKCRRCGSRVQRHDD